MRPHAQYTDPTTWDQRPRVNTFGAETDTVTRDVSGPEDPCTTSRSADSRIERVPKTVTQEIEREDREQDRQARKNAHPGTIA